MTEAQTAFNTLVDLAARSRRSAKGLPAQSDIQQLWSGIGFVLMGQHFVAPLGEISELLEVPSYTQLPGVQPWVLGVANVRGRLLPLFDMAIFFGSQLDSHRKSHRVLVLEQDGLYSGLVVDAALGMQHFPVETYEAATGDLDAELKNLVGGSYRKPKANSPEEEQQWYVFSPIKLVDEPRFVNAAQ